MFVCICNGVTDSHIRQAVMSGNATTLREIRDTLGAMSQCGKCAQLTKEVIEESKQLVNNANDNQFYEVAQN